MNQKTTIQIFCAINPSEDPDKVKTAVNNIFPEIKLDVSETEISGKTNNFSILSQISKSIREKNIRNTYQRILKRNNDGDSTWFYLNKQAAFVNTVALCSEALEINAWLTVGGRRRRSACNLRRYSGSFSI